MDNSDITQEADSFDKTQCFVRLAARRSRISGRGPTVAEEIAAARKVHAIERRRKRALGAKLYMRAHAERNRLRSLERYYRLTKDAEFRRLVARRSTEADRKKPLAHRARARVLKAVIRGKLPPVSSLKCVDCGRLATDYDHRDYTKPLEVEPTCRSCNLLRGPGYPYNQ